MRVVERTALIGWGSPFQQCSNLYLPDAQGIALLRESKLLDRLHARLWESISEGVAVPYSIGDAQLSANQAAAALFSVYPHCISTVGLAAYAHNVVERLVLLETEEKRRALVNYEDSHYLGLTMLEALCSDLDLRLQLCLEYGLTEALFRQQASIQDSVGSETGVVLDMSLVARHALLNRLYCISGGSERPPEAALRGEISLLLDHSEFTWLSIADPVVSDTSVIGIISATSGVPPSEVKDEIFLFAMFYFLLIEC